MQSIVITTVLGSEREQQIKEVLQHVLAKYDLDDYAFTRKVQIDGNRVPPHSHPILTLNTREDDEHHLLATYLHEQIHWFLDAHAKDEAAAMNELRAIYPEVPDSYPEGAKSEESTYRHLIVCPLELKLLKKLIGDAATEKYLENVHGYFWIYKTAMADYDKLLANIRKHGLDLT